MLSFWPSHVKEKTVSLSHYPLPPSSPRKIRCHPATLVSLATPYIVCLPIQLHWEFGLHHSKQRFNCGHWISHTDHFINCELWKLYGSWKNTASDSFCDLPLTFVKLSSTNKLMTIILFYIEIMYIMTRSLNSFDKCFME